jgi:hypothetical protein
MYAPLVPWPAGRTAWSHPNRDTVAAIEEAGFEIETFESFYPPDPLSRLTPHVQGSATVRLAA